MSVSGAFMNNDEVVLACATNFATTDPNVTCRCNTTGSNNTFICTADVVQTTDVPTCLPGKSQTNKSLYCTFCTTLKQFYAIIDSSNDLQSNSFNISNALIKYFANVSIKMVSLIPPKDIDKTSLPSMPQVLFLTPITEQGKILQLKSLNPN